MISLKVEFGLVFNRAERMCMRTGVQLWTIAGANQNVPDENELLIRVEANTVIDILLKRHSRKRRQVHTLK